MLEKYNIKIIILKYEVLKYNRTKESKINIT